MPGTRIRSPELRYLQLRKSPQTASCKSYKISIWLRSAPDSLISWQHPRAPRSTLAMASDDEISLMSLSDEEKRKRRSPNQHHRRHFHSQEGCQNQQVQHFHSQGDPQTRRQTCWTKPRSGRRWDKPSACSWFFSPMASWTVEKPAKVGLKKNRCGWHLGSECRLIPMSWSV